MTTPERPKPNDTPLQVGKPDEFTAAAPRFSGKVSNRPTASGADVTGFDQAAEEERQRDA